MPRSTSLFSRFTTRWHLLKQAFLALLVCWAALSALTATAHAGADSFCTQAVGAGGICIGPNHSVTAVRGWNYTSGAGCAGTYGYGSFYCAAPAGCHVYDGSAVRTPAIRHRSATAKSMTAYSTWGSTGPPAYCDSGTVYAVAGSLDSAMPPGIPVLDRPATAAPEVVAALVPAADPDKARTFTTPRGSAWVLTDAGGGRVCLVAQDGDTGYGYSCQRTGAARSAGSLQTLEDGDDTTAAGDVVIALAGEGVDGLTVQGQDGSTRVVPARGGVIVTTLTGQDQAVELPPAAGAGKGAKAQRLTMARGR